MDTAVVGFLGVIAGSMTTGGVQHVVESNRRRNDSLMAGRLVYGALVEVDQAVAAYTKWGDVPSRASFQRQVAIWEDQKEKLARVLDVVDLQIVQAAFSNIWFPSSQQTARGASWQREPPSRDEVGTRGQLSRVLPGVGE